MSDETPVNRPEQGSGPPPPSEAGGVSETTEARSALVSVRDEVSRMVVGQPGALSGLMAAVLAGGHVLLEGVPGVAKTLMAKSLAASLELDYTRIQFTPDLMPSDVTGRLVLDEQAGLHFRPGPVFTNVLLADEINRTPPKTQAALLEAMEEGQVTVEGERRELPDPFLVIATQNPIEYEGTYPLPEAQLDRFLFKLVVGYPSADDELEILRRHRDGLDPHQVTERLAAVADRRLLATARAQVEALPVSDSVLRYVAELVRATRTSPAVALGVSPRGAVMLVKAARAWAWLSGRTYVRPDEVKAIAPSVMRHRVQLRPELAIEGTSAETVISSLLSSVPLPT